MATLAPRFRDPKSGVWMPAVILPDELGAAIAQEVHRTLQGGHGRTDHNASLAKVFGTPLEQLIRGLDQQDVTANDASPVWLHALAPVGS
jgi:hypothetical protein